MKHFNTALKTAVVFGASFLLFAACGKKDDGGGGGAVTPPNPCVGATSNYVNNTYCVNGQPVIINGMTKTLQFQSSEISGVLNVAMTGNGSLTGPNGYGSYNPQTQTALYSYYGPVAISGTITIDPRACFNWTGIPYGTYSLTGTALSNNGIFTDINLMAGPFNLRSVYSGSVVYQGESRIGLDLAMTFNGNVNCGRLSYTN